MFIKLCVLKIVGLNRFKFYLLFNIIKFPTRSVIAYFNLKKFHRIVKQFFFLNKKKSLKFYKNLNLNKQSVLF